MRERQKQRNRDPKKQTYRQTKKQKIINQLSGLYNKKLFINTVKKIQ